MASKISRKISHSSSSISKVILPYLKKTTWCKYTVVFSSWYIDFAWGLWILHETLFWSTTSLSQILSITIFFQVKYIPKHFSTLLQFLAYHATSQTQSLGPPTYKLQIHSYLPPWPLPSKYSLGTLIWPCPCSWSSSLRPSCNRYLRESFQSSSFSIHPHFHFQWVNSFH